jgi:hypothetical protein
MNEKNELNKKLNSVIKYLETEKISYRYFKNGAFVRVRLSKKQMLYIKRNSEDEYEITYYKLRANVIKGERKQIHNVHDFKIFANFKGDLYEVMARVRDDYLKNSISYNDITIAEFVIKVKHMGLNYEYLAQRWGIKKQSIVHFITIPDQLKLPENHQDDFRNIWEKFLADCQDLLKQAREDGGLKIKMKKFTKMSKHPYIADDKGITLPMSYYASVIAGAMAKGARIMVVFDGK